MLLGVISYKGGVGKTTVSTNLATVFAANGSSVCILDADESANSLNWSEGRDDDLPNVHVIAHTNKKTIAKTIQKLYDEYDVVIIDSPPSQDEISSMIILMCHLVIVPLLPKGKQETNTINQLLERVENLEITKGKKIPLHFVVNEFDGRLTLHKEFVKLLNKMYPKKIFKTKLHNRVVYSEVTHEGKGVSEASDKKAKQEIVSLAKEIMKIV